MHLSFVRSVTMDKWKPLELEKMRCGGNARCRAFLETQPDYNDGMDFHEQYNSRACALYRDKISTEAKGGAWVESRSSAKSWVPPNSAPAATSSSNVGGSMRTGSGGSGSDDPVFGNGMTVSAMKASTNDFFASKTAANANRSDKLKPSEGGKYAGFGSSGASYTPKQSSSGDALAILSKGWSTFAAGAAEIASVVADKTQEIGSQVNEAVIAPAREKLAEGELLSSISASISEAADRVKESVEKIGASSSSTRSMRSSRSGRDGSGRSTSPDDDADFFAAQMEQAQQNGFSTGSRGSSKSSRAASHNTSSRSASGSSPKAKAAGDDGWGDDGWGEVSPTKSKSKGKSKSIEKSKAAPKKTAAKKSADGDGWGDGDDWGNDW